MSFSGVFCVRSLFGFVGAASGCAIFSAHIHRAVNYLEHAEPDVDGDDSGSRVKFGLCSTFYSLRWINWYIFSRWNRFCCPFHVFHWQGQHIPLTLKCMRVNTSQQPTEASYRFLLRCELNVYWLLLFPARYWLFVGHQPIPIPIRLHFHRQLFDFANKKFFLSIEAVLGLRPFFSSLLARVH